MAARTYGDLNPSCFVFTCVLLRYVAPRETLCRDLSPELEKHNCNRWGVGSPGKIRRCNLLICLNKEFISIVVSFLWLTMNIQKLRAAEAWHVCKRTHGLIHTNYVFQAEQHHHLLLIRLAGSSLLLIPPLLREIRLVLTSICLLDETLRHNNNLWTRRNLVKIINTPCFCQLAVKPEAVPFYFILCTHINVSVTPVPIALTQADSAGGVRSLSPILILCYGHEEKGKHDLEGLTCLRLFTEMSF